MFFTGSSKQKISSFWIFRNKFSSATNYNFYQPNLILPHWCRWSYGSLVIVVGIKVWRSLVLIPKKSFSKIYIKIPNFISIFCFILIDQKNIQQRYQINLSPYNLLLYWLCFYFILSWNLKVPGSNPSRVTIKDIIV